MVFCLHPIFFVCILSFCLHRDRFWFFVCIRSFLFASYLFCLHPIFLFASDLFCLHPIFFVCILSFLFAANHFYCIDRCGPPYMIPMKTIFQILCQRKIRWDAELEGDLRLKFCRFISELQKLSDLRTPCCLFTNRAVDSQLHGYSDASDLAYACVIYLRSLCKDCGMETKLVTP